MTLSAEMAIAEPSRFGKPWLIAIIGKTKRILGMNVKCLICLATLVLI